MQNLSPASIMMNKTAKLKKLAQDRGLPEEILGKFKKGLIPECLRNKAIDYVTSFKRTEGKGMLIYGDVGAGKTYFMAYLLFLFLDRAVYLQENEDPYYETEHGLVVRKDYFYDFDFFWADSRLILECYHNYESDNRQKIFKKKVLLWDEFDVEKRTDWEFKALDDVLLHRYNAGLTTIITTNLSIKDLREMREEPKYRRMMDRLLDQDRFIRILVRGGTKRRIR